MVSTSSTNGDSSTNGGGSTNGIGSSTTEGGERHPMTGNRMDPGSDTGHETHEYDVVVIGAGGAGLRAAIAAHDAGARVAVVCKSLLGKAHTVMAEGGIAASMGNVYPEDGWQVHFRDTMRGGKMLNNWRMAQLHAQEAPDRVL
ncbi:MAG: FAD-binding protein, partial [Nocardioides sp.]